MTLVIAMVAVSVALGLSAQELDRGTKVRLLALITAISVVTLLRGDF